MNIIMLGAPGAGKGTQAVRLAQEFGLEHLSSGDLLRAERKSGTALGQKVAAYMDSGSLVPDAIIIEVIIARILKSTSSNGVLLDGFPRTVGQAQKLDEAFVAAGKKVDLVLSLVVPDEDIVSRITGRRVCPNCNAVYHMVYQPPKQAGVCDKDGAALLHRSDDTEDVVKQRLAAYHSQTQPLEDYYRAKGLVVEVDGRQAMDLVFSQSAGIVRQRL